MRAAITVLVAALVLAISSCIPSVHPVYDEDTRVYDASLLGTWKAADDKNSDEAWVFGPGLRTDNTYLLTQTDEEGNSGEFTANLVEIDGTLFMDLFPEEWKSEENGFYWLHLYPMHTFMKLELEADSLHMYLLDIEWLDSYLEVNPGAVAHTYSSRSSTFPNEDNTWPLLTAPTGELQPFLASIVDEPEAWSDPMELSREAVKTDWKIRIEGDKLFIDEESWLAKYSTDSGHPAPVFHKFNGVYPPDWPKGNLLPEGYYLRNEKLELSDARNPDSQAAGIRSMRFTGLSPLSIDETIDWFRTQGIAAGFSKHSDGSGSTVGKVAAAVEAFGPGSHRISFDTNLSHNPLMLVNIWFHEDLGGYTYVGGFINVDINN